MGEMRLLCALAVSTILLAGCSFSREWRAATRNLPPGNELAGPWEGRWISEVNGHNGRLRCIMTKKSTDHYDAKFHAKYKKIFSFGYTVPMQVRKQGDKWLFEGEADLGKLAGGVYSYAGEATPTNFFSTYKSKYDHGKFEMARPVSQ